jgi:hypothetical protein
MAAHQIAFRLPLPGWPRAVLETDYGLRGGRLVVDGAAVLELEGKDALARGGRARLPGTTSEVELRLDPEDPTKVLLAIDGVAAEQEDRLHPKASRSTWIHALLGLIGSGAGFAASALYLLKSKNESDAWALKMSLHMAGWHLLLVLTLFPSSIFGGRVGIRLVQIVSTVFFAIHVGIAVANIGQADDPWIAVFNGVSGLFFLAAGVYGQRAWRDMDPLRALQHL